MTIQPYEAPLELGSFEFHGDQVVVVTNEHGSWAVLGQLCQNLTLDANGQRQAIERKSWSEGKTCVMHVMLPGQDRAYPQFLIHERVVPMWLANITTSRIKDDEKRGKVERAQTELADALYAYVTQHSAPRPAELTRLEILRMALEAEEQNQVLRAEKLELTSKVAELAPMAAQAEHYRSADGLIAVADFANDLKGWAKQIHDVRVLHPEVWEFLGEIGLIIRGNTIRRNRPTAFAVEKDYVREKKTTFDTSTRGLQASWSPRLTPAGAGFAWDKAVIRITEHHGLRMIEAA